MLRTEELDPPKLLFQFTDIPFSVSGIYQSFDMAIKYMYIRSTILGSFFQGPVPMFYNLFVECLAHNLSQILIGVKS